MCGEVSSSRGLLLLDGLLGGEGVLLDGGGVGQLVLVEVLDALLELVVLRLRLDGCKKDLNQQFLGGNQERQIIRNKRIMLTK